MEALYQCTIFVALALLAIVTAIFVFASSFYKGALEFSIKEEERSFNRRKEVIGKEKAELGKKLESADEGALAKELRAELNKFDAELKEIDKSIATSKNKPKALTASNLVTIPGSLLLASIVTSGIAIITSGTLSTVMWGISLLVMVISVYFIYKSLTTVDFFSRVIDLSVLVEQALERHSEKRRPIVDLDTPDYELIIEHGDTQEIKPSLFLKQGLTAKNITIRFLTTKELDFPKEKLKKFSIPKENMRDPRYFFRKESNLNYGVYREIPIKLKAPEKPGNYYMSYWITCDEYTGEETFFAIKVV